MTEPAGDPIVDDRYWRTLLFRAIILIVVALIAAFSPDHSTNFGLILFGSTMVALGVAGLVTRSSIVDYRARRLVDLAATTNLVAAAVALALALAGNTNLILTMMIWAAVAGLLELVAGLRARGRDPVSREWVTSGVITAVFALALLLVPANYSLTYQVPVKGGDPLTLVLDAPVIAVGLFGAYAALLGVYLMIAAVSLRKPVEAAASGASV